MTFNIGELMAWAVLAFFAGWTLGGFVRDRKWMMVGDMKRHPDTWEDSMYVGGKRFFVLEHGNLEQAEKVLEETKVIVGMKNAIVNRGW